ncbi:HU-CCDC81 and SPOR domain-containing protein [Spirosoma taeanense]|uniref:HU-CCDC81 and SPOR domain-containing protein n=1 Tax=Spirosoma taeanense TaxID=2735870 RepID=A0A6M5YA00_9BACT|nr:SPOR domain-containing protein [Spirosoma taeanense]QJW90043.1 HU-CCDC81 and SPOR domain-containing protein [Spirosoma taeanense]
MASVNDYLKKLLYQYDCVVVPELGAFLTHYQPASFTETSGLYLPPRKRVAFNEALRLDDGILANYIMLHEPVTREGAQRHIGLFVSELRQQIETTGRFELDGIGTFSHNEEGRLQFDPSLRHNFFGEAYGMSALSVQLLNPQQQPEPALEAVPLTALGPVLVRDEEMTLVPHRPSRSYWRVAATALLVGSLGLVSYFSVIKPGQPLQGSLDPANLFRVPAAWLNYGAYAAETPVSVVRKAAPASKPAPTPAPTPVAVQAVATPTPVTTPAVEPVVTKAPAAKVQPVITAPVVAVKPVPAYSGPRFTVIAGSFSSKRNALRLKRQLRKAGYMDAYVIMPAVKGQLYKVAAAGSTDRTEAIASVAAVSQLAHTPAWILKN